MYDVTEKYKELILTDNTKHALHVYVDGTEIDSKYILDFKVSPVLFENDEFCFGNTPQRTCELKIHKDALPDEYDEFYITTGIETTSYKEIVPIGYFYKDDITEKDSYTITLKLGDKMSEFDEAFDGSELNYPITNLELLQAICDKHGIELGSTSFTNSDSKISVYDSTVTARTYIGYIAELAGGFATIGRDGKLYIRMIGEDTDSLAINKFAEYEWGDEFIISRVAYEDGIQDFKTGDETANTVWLDSNNMFVSSQEQIDNIYNNYADTSYYSFSGTSIVDPAWDIGDVIEIDGKNIIFQGTMSYKGKFKAEFDSEIKAKTQESSMQTTVSDTTKIRRVQSSIDQIEGEITQVVEEVDENSSAISQHTQDIESITDKISSIVDYIRTASQTNYLYISGDDVPTGEGYITSFIVYGGKNFTSKNITICASTKPKGYGDNLNIDTEDSENILTEDDENLVVGASTYYTKIVELILPDILREYTDNDGTTYYDTLEITQDGTVILTRRIGIDNDENLYLLDEEVVTIYGIEELWYVWNDTAILPTFEDGTYYYVLELDALSYYAEYINNKDYVTRIEMNSSISQTAEEINLTVSKKVDETEIISKINQSAEEIQIQADKISLEGKEIDLTSDEIIIDSTYFSVDKEGNAVASSLDISNGSIDIESSGTLNIYNSSNEKLLELNNGGLKVYNSDYEVGRIEGSKYTSDNTQRGLAFHLEEKRKLYDVGSKRRGG